MFETKQCQEFVCGVQARKLLEQLDECAELRIMCWISSPFQSVQQTESNAAPGTAGCLGCAPSVSVIE